MNAQKELDAAIAKVLLYSMPDARGTVRLWLRVVVTAAKCVQLESTRKVKS